MTTIYENQSIAFTDLSGNTATISPDVGFTITTPSQTLTANVNGFTNGVQSLLFSDLYAGVQKTESIIYAASTPTKLSVVDTIEILDAYPLFNNVTRITPTQIKFTDGTITNTLDKNDWTGNIRSENTTADLVHYLGFFDSSGTGYGYPKKTALLSCNPSLSIISATTFSGNATSSTTTTGVNLTSDNTSGTYYIPFSKTITATQNALYVDNITGPLSYNPSTSTLTSLLINSQIVQPIAQNTATFTSNTLSINGSSITFKNSNINFTGGSNTVSNLILTNMIVGGEYKIGIYNGGSNNLTFNTGLGTNIRTLYSSNININNGSYGFMVINVLTINALTIYIVQVNQLT
jgi:hypothetical protein